MFERLISSMWVRIAIMYLMICLLLMVIELAATYLCCIVNG